jgi:hypothetical protein
MPEYHGFMFRMGRGDSPFSAPKAEFVTSDPGRYLAWVDRMEAQGYVEAEEYEEFVNMLRAMSKKRQAELSKPYDPTPEQVAADRANRPSGKGQKPMPKPTRDYQGASMPKGPWTGERRVMPKGPSSPAPTTKRFPHLGGQTGPQARGE